MIHAYHEIVRITEEEMWQLRNENAKLSKGFPAFYSISRAGRVTFWPELAWEHNNIGLYCGVVEES